MQASIVCGRSFTMEYAKEQYPEHMWKTPLVVNSTRAIAASWITNLLIMATAAVVSGIVLLKKQLVDCMQLTHALFEASPCPTFTATGESYHRLCILVTFTVSLGFVVRTWAAQPDKRKVTQHAATCRLTACVPQSVATGGCYSERHRRRTIGAVQLHFAAGTPPVCGCIYDCLPHHAEEALGLH